MPKAQKKAGLTTDFSKDLWSPAEASNLRQQFSEMTEGTPNSELRGQSHLNSLF